MLDFLKNKWSNRTFIGKLLIIITIISILWLLIMFAAGGFSVMLSDVKSGKENTLGMATASAILFTWMVLLTHLLVIFGDIPTTIQEEQDQLKKASSNTSIDVDSMSPEERASLLKKLTQ